MTGKKHSSRFAGMKALFGNETDALKTLMKEVLQEILDGEMTELLGAERHERNTERTGYRSGYYTRSLVTRIGKLELRIPRDRNGEFSTALFERYQLDAHNSGTAALRLQPDSVTSSPINGEQSDTWRCSPSMGMHLEKNAQEQRRYDGASGSEKTRLSSLFAKDP